MNNLSQANINDTVFPFWDDMIQMEKELPLKTQMLLYKTEKKCTP